ncbi:MAG: hypothetical protein COA43_09530 [Robiginitomaculum sp.]|nr:MAG: hypothetical protein COA43_09530 [Robiginitomaculum sp.]
MKLNFLTDSRIKTALLSPVFVGMSAALLLGACGDKGAKAANVAVDGRTTYETATDHAMGSITAPITVVEYASLTCPHCATWSLSVFPEFQKKFIDTGKVRYVFREFPTPPVDLARAGHLLTNCAPEEKYFDLLHAQFRQQESIRTSSDIKGEFIKLAKSAGMSEADFDACMVNQEELDKLQAVIIGGANAGVTGTPMFFINGEISSNTFTIEQFDKAFAKALGEPIPEPSEKSDETEKSGH